MKNNIEYFEWADAWVFTSLFMYDTNYKNLVLVSVLANGDALNHAVFELNELSTGLSKLVKNNLIEIKENEIRLTKLGAEVKIKSENLKGGLFEKVDNTFKVLNQLRIETNKYKILEFNFLNEEKLNEAYNQYTHKPTTSK